LALTFDQITAITDKYYMPKFPQLVFDQNLVQKILANKGTKPSSGESIKQPVMYQMGKGGAFDPFDTFDISAEDQITAADFNWKYYEVPVTISRDEILKNQGPEGVKKLLDAKMKLAAMKMGDLLATDMFEVTTSPGQDSTTKLNSLEMMLEDSSGTLVSDGGSGISGTTYGGIDKSVYTWWSGNVTTAASGDGVNYSDLCGPFYEVCDGNIQPDLVVMHNTSFASYMKGEQAQQRYMKQSELDAGFLTATFNGKRVVADLHVQDSAGHATTNRIYFLNTDFIDFVTHRDENNRLEPFAKPVDQAVGVAHIMWAGELTCCDCSRNGVIADFDSNSVATW